MITDDLARPLPCTTMFCRLAKGEFQTIKLLPLLLREFRFRCVLGRRKFANFVDLGLGRLFLRDFQQRPLSARPASLAASSAADEMAAIILDRRTLSRETPSILAALLSPLSCG